MKYFIIFFLLFYSIIYSYNDNTLPHPYCDIEILSPNHTGFFINQKELKNLIETYNIETYNIQTVVELGSWLGASTIFIARLIPENGCLYAVDHWKGSEEHHNRPDKRYQNLLPILYEQFLSNVIDVKLTHKIVPIKMTTIEASKILNISPDLIYIDAAHDEQSVYNDLINWYPKLAKNGIMCGDDRTHTGVLNAITKFANENNLEIFGTRQFWYFPPKIK